MVGKLRGQFSLPHRTKTAELEDLLFLETREKVCCYSLLHKCIVFKCGLIYPPTYINQIVSSVKRATSIALTSDSASLPTGESYVAVTGHWIDKTPCEKAEAGLFKWRLTILAVSVDNGKSIF